MAGSSCSTLTHRIRAFSRATGLATAAASLLALGLWALLFESVRTPLLATSPLSLLILTSSGLALYLLQASRPLALLVGQLLAWAPVFYGSLSVAGSLFAPLLASRLLGALPSLQTALAFLLTGLALLTLDWQTRQNRFPSEVFALSALMLAYVTLVGYAFNLGGEAPHMPFRGMPLAMAFGLSLLVTGALCARPTHGLMARLTGGSLGGSVLRRLAPAAFWSPVFLGWLRLAGERAGLFGPELGAALVTMLMGLVGVGLVLWNVEALDRTEAEREGIQRALQESETRYRLVTDYSSDLLTLHQPGGPYLYVSPAAEQLLGYRPEELVGKHPGELIERADWPLIESTRRELLATHRPMRVRYRIRRKDGVVRWFESTIQDVPAEGPGEVEAMLVVSRDVTERVEAEDALRESEDRYRRLVELSPEAIMVDMGGQLIFVNPAGARLIGAQDAGQLIGRSLVEFVHPAYVQAFREEMEKARRAGHPTVMFEKKLLRLDGSTVDVETTASPITYGGKEAMIAIIRDVTERKKALEEIAMRTAELKKANELDRLKDHFLSTLSHEMKTPLSLIVGYSELLEDKYPDETLVEGIQDGARRLKEHIDSMLDYSALLSGTLPLYEAEVDLPEIVETALHITQAGRASHDHPTRVEVDPDTPPVTADPRRVTQVLVELLDNACRFTPAGGAIGVRVAPVDGHVALTVWDTGPGIRPEELVHIWEPFGQLAIGNTGRTGGLGLGLTIARKLMELHGGRLGVESEPGRGSRFTAVLPVQPPEKKDPPKTGGS